MVVLVLYAPRESLSEARHHRRPDVHHRVVSAAAEQGISVSAWMTEAARRALLVRDGLAAVAEWERLHGSFTPEEMTMARHRVAEELGTKRKRSA